MLDLIVLLEAEFYNNLGLESKITCKYFQIFQLYLRRHIERSAASVTGERNSVLFQNFLMLVENNFKQKGLLMITLLSCT